MSKLNTNLYKELVTQFNNRLLGLAVVLQPNHQLGHSTNRDCDRCE